MFVDVSRIRHSGKGVRSRKGRLYVFLMRDEFSAETKRAVAARVNQRCSRPECRAPTFGPTIDPEKCLNVGVAAHISGASPAGPRFDEGLNSEQRSHPTNAIWLCQTCAKLVDNDTARYSEGVLRAWKAEGESLALMAIGRATGHSEDLSKEEMAILIAAVKTGDISVMETHLGNWVRAGVEDFTDNHDALVAALHLEALDSMMSRGLARHEKRQLYKLTGTGLRLARQLTIQQTQEALGATVENYFAAAQRKTATMAVVSAQQLASDLSQPLPELTLVLNKMVAEHRIYFDAMTGVYSVAPMPWVR